MTARQVLRNKFPAEEYVLLCEVPDHVGQRNRSLDFMIINLWGSRGYSITGIEQKSNRGDWLKELKNPAKQENHFRHCEYFYLLTDKEGVAKLEEIPENWGWYHINGSKILKTMKAAPKLTSIPVDRALLCAMLRRAADKTGYVHKEELDTQIKLFAENEKMRADRDLTIKAHHYDELKKKVDEFEKYSGINITHSWSTNLKDIGKAVQILQKGNLEEYMLKLERIENQMGIMHKGISSNIEILKIEINTDLLVNLDNQ